MLCFAPPPLHFALLPTFVPCSGPLCCAIKSFYEMASACVKIGGETSEHFEIKMGLRQGCVVMSPWQFSIYMDGCIREMKVEVWDLGARLNVRVVWLGDVVSWRIFCGPGLEGYGRGERTERNEKGKRRAVKG